MEKKSERKTQRPKLKADQIRTLDKARVVKRIGKLEQKEVGEIEKAMKIHVGLI